MEDSYSSDAVLIVEVHGEKLMVEPPCVDGLLDRLQQPLVKNNFSNKIPIGIYFCHLSKIESPEEHLGNSSYDLGASAGSRYSDHSALR